MKSLIATTVLAAFLALPVGAEVPQKDPPAKAAAIDGTYTIVSGEEGGKAIPDERIKGAVVKFGGGKVVGTDKDKKQFFAADYTLDTTKKPWVIEMKSTAPKEATASGLVKVDGDTLTLIYALPGGEAPKEFKTKDKQQLFVLKRAAKEPPKP
jgi:uncharacterized protein (TIGR03067 family)